MKKISSRELLQYIENNFSIPIEKDNVKLSAELVLHAKNVLNINLANPTEKVSYQHFECLALLTGIAIQTLGYERALEITVLYSSILYTLVDLTLMQIEAGQQSIVELNKINDAISKINDENTINIEIAASPNPEIAIQSTGIVISMLALGSYIKQ